METTIVFRVSSVGRSATAFSSKCVLSYVAPKMENQMKKKMEHEMETEGIQRLYRGKFEAVTRPGKKRSGFRV